MTTTSVPVAYITDVTGGAGHPRCIRVRCPYCDKTHGHGWPENRDDIGARSSHCSGDPYTIEIPPGPRGEKLRATAEAIVSGDVRTGSADPFICRGCGTVIGKTYPHYLLDDYAVVCGSCLCDEGGHARHGNRAGIRRILGKVFA